MTIYKIGILSLLGSLFLLFCIEQEAQSLWIKGTVYEDINQNGNLDPGEPGIPGVPVSNQIDVVLTDKDGNYTLTIEEDTIVFITKPSGYQVPLSKDSLPQFYYIYKKYGSPKLYYRGSSPSGSLPATINFPLRKVEEKDNFKVLAIADPQPETIQEVDYIRQDLVEEVIPTDASLAIILGDIVFDRLDLLDFYKPLMGQIGIPLYHVMGNHDVNYDALEDRYSDETFERHFGPAYYSFEYAQVHFVVLDSVYFYREKDQENKTNYEGRLGKKQLKWLQKDISFVPPEKLVVLLMHIPLHTYTSKGNRDKILDRAELFAILKDRKHILALAGHTHQQEHQFLGHEVGWHGEKPLHQIICLTLCGSWWSGPPDERGVPIAIQQDGVPNGYQIIEFFGNQYRSTLKVSHQSQDCQMYIHSPQGIISYKDISNMEILVNVFDSSPRSKTYYSINNSDFVPLKNVYQKDPMAVSLFDKNRQPVKSWVRSSPTWNLWSSPLPPLEKGMHKIIVKTIDQYGRTFQNARVFYIW